MTLSQTFGLVVYAAFKRRHHNYWIPKREKEKELHVNWTELFVVKNEIKYLISWELYVHMNVGKVSAQSLRIYGRCYFS